MSEANAPLNRPDPSIADPSVSQGTPAEPGWENPFTALVEEALESSAADSLFEQEALKQEVLKQELLKWEDSAAPAKPIAQSAEAPPPDKSTDKPTETPISRPSLPDPTAAIAAWSENAANAAEPTDITDLISLLQELNQCNSILLDRVSQLEEALESSQIALQAEVGRSQDYQTIASQMPENLTSAQEQIVSLFNQLEFAHQTHQRQQILIETLTGQLETSQERVAQLERESALLQQHYSERLQQLAQVEGTNRDLQARLHRQQRYTLQFKVALEKCLEVPAPQYDLGEAAPALDEQSFLPKTQRIQPWTSVNEILTPRAAWMKLHTLGLEGLDEPQAANPPQLIAPIQDTSPKTTAPAPVQTKTPETEIPSSQEPTPKQSIIQLPVTQNLEPAEPVLNDPALIQQIDTAVQPLVDKLAEAIRKGTSIQEAVQSLAIDPPEPTNSNDLPPELPIKLSAELLTESPAAPAPAREPASPPPEPAASAPAQLNAEDEDDLWQDLARLIEVSTEDVVKASLSGDFAAFEAIDFEALQAQEMLMAEPEAVSHSSPQAVASPIPQAPQASQSTSPLPSPSADTPVAPESTQSESFIPALIHSSWPSPVIHPLRPAKKQRSPGTVDLPSFVRPDTHPDMA